jgi:hypothetical protein
MQQFNAAFLKHVSKKNFFSVRKRLFPLRKRFKKFIKRNFSFLFFFFVPMDHRAVKIISNVISIFFFRPDGSSGLSMMAAPEDAIHRQEEEEREKHYNNSS